MGELFFLSTEHSRKVFSTTPITQHQFYITDSEPRFWRASSQRYSHGQKKVYESFFPVFVPVLRFIIQIRQRRRCISTGRVSLNKTGSTLVCVCWELLFLPSWGSSLVRTGSLARLLICSTYDRENAVEWKEELIKLLRTSENTLRVTQISTWELKSSLRYSRRLWLEFTTSSTAETQLNSSRSCTFQHEEYYFIKSYTT